MHCDDAGRKSAPRLWAIQPLAPEGEAQPSVNHNAKNKIAAANVFRKFGARRPTPHETEAGLSQFERRIGLTFPALSG